MDYHRIYREFIADRKRREAGLTGYSEAHHIIPRHLGGSDDPDNLIRLTAEDHFFAHLVLAKWLNTMPAWGAVMVMHERKRRSTIFRRKARLRYGWARRKYAKFCTVERRGAANPNYKPEIIALKRSTGEVVEKSRSEWNMAGVPHAPLCAVMSGKSKSYKGWMLPDTDPEDTGRKAAARAKRNNTVYRWVHIDGRSEAVAIHELASRYGLRAEDLASVVRGEHGICAGWYIEGRSVGWPSGRKHFTDDRVHHLVKDDGRTRSGTQRQLVADGLLAQQDVSSLVNGRRKSANGWMLSEVAASGYQPRTWQRRPSGQDA